MEEKEEERQTYIVSHEEVVSIRGVTTDSKELDKVIKLAVNIAANGYRTLHRLNIPFLNKDRSRLIAERPHIYLR